ncbi:MAG TPA: R3H domain-containing nucleic acid-binding protein [Terriglobales bacterium]|nr:R3H domain-containing nucleic acid-binding protein [Terriglobales bacterium]
MPIPDKLAAAKQIETLLRKIIQYGDFRLRYRITIDPPMPEDRDWERPEILVELSGPDSDLLLARGAELLRSFELLALESLEIDRGEHDKVIFDCMNHRAMRLEELRLAANVAAERVRKSGRPYEFGPMSSRERRILHLSLREFEDLRTESEGAGADRHVVLFPKDYKPRPAPPSFSRRR